MEIRIRPDATPQPMGLDTANMRVATLRRRQTRANGLSALLALSGLFFYPLLAGSVGSAVVGGIAGESADRLEKRVEAAERYQASLRRFHPRAKVWLR